MPPPTASAQGASADEVNLAILVQEFIAADSSAVAFTVNPVTNDASEIVINAYWGLGEGLVDGSSIPDTYTVDKRELWIKTRSVAKKERMCAAGSPGSDRNRRASRQSVRGQL